MGRLFKSDVKSVFVATENSSYSVHELSHAAVSPKSLCRIKMYHIAIIISQVNNVFELDKESTVSFFLSYCGETMIDVLTEICNRIWRTGEWPTPNYSVPDYYTP